MSLGYFVVVTDFGCVFNAIISVGICPKFVWMGTVSSKLDKWSIVWAGRLMSDAV